MLQEIEMTVTQVTAFRAKDGKLFETRDEADRHSDFVQVCDIYKTRHKETICSTVDPKATSLRRVFAITRELMLHRQVIHAASNATSADKQACTVEKKLDTEAIDLLVRARACIKKLDAPDATGEHIRNELARAIKAYLNKVYGSTDWNIQSEPTKADPVIEQPAPEAK